MQMVGSPHTSYTVLMYMRIAVLLYVHDAFLSANRCRPLR